VGLLATRNLIKDVAAMIQDK